MQQLSERNGAGMVRQGRLLLPGVTSFAIILAFLSTIGHARAAAPATEAHPRGGPSSEVARLEAELREQRQIIMQLMQVEQQHYDLLLKLIQSGIPAGAPGALDGKATTAPPLLLSPGPAGSVAGVESPAPTRRAVERTATVSGKVAVTAGDKREIYVFAQNVHSAPLRGRSIEIGQRDKQFVPQVAVVQRGTRVVFPNYDAVFHNVFSSAPPHPFDLGSYRAGESPRAIEMTSPGVVEVFCNIHSKMRASILVVPSPVWTRAAPDGSYRLDNVPVGTRKLVAWSVGARPAEQSIEVTATGGVANFRLDLEAERPHNNKYGLPYSSY